MNINFNSNIKFQMFGTENQVVYVDKFDDRFDLTYEEITDDGTFNTARPKSYSLTELQAISEIKKFLRHQPTIVNGQG